ncbi:MAG TPA: DUF2878 domain-containing protein [Methylophilaceae bacterium]|jgi:hypothetical protein
MLINFLGFQLGWFSCVLGAAHGMPWLGPLITLPIVALHVASARIIRAELLLLTIVTLIGSVFDQLLLLQGWIQYPASGWPATLLPIWMVALWMLFCTTLNVSLRWMRLHTLTAMIFGFMGGPLAYLGGQRLGAMILVEPKPLILTLALGWGLLMPALLWISKRFDGYAPVLNVETVQVV